MDTFYWPIKFQSGPLSSVN